MDYTEQQKQEFQDDFATRRRRQAMISIPVILAFIALLVGADNETSTVYCYPLAMVVPVLLVISASESSSL